MSERWGKCRICIGEGCGICGDTGFSGDIQDYLDPANRLRDTKVQKPKPDKSIVMDRVFSAFEDFMKGMEHGT